MASETMIRPDLYIGTAAHPRIRVTERTLTGAPEFLHGLKTLFVTDIHLGPEQPVEPILRMIEVQQPELLLLGGDLADSRTQAQRILNALSEIKPRFGTYAVAGNNDLEAFGSVAVLRNVLEHAGIQLLYNEETHIALPDGLLTVGGVAEYKYGQPDASGLFQETGNARLLLSHFPIVPKDCRADWILSGHTHGGQGNFLGITPYSLGFERNPKRRCDLIVGSRAFGKTVLIVSKGIGCSRIPLRLFVQSEIDLLNFQK